jgi:hypothetical protein
MKHGTLQTYSYPGDIRPGLEDILSASAQMMDHQFWVGLAFRANEIYKRGLVVLMISTI